MPKSKNLSKQAEKVLATYHDFQRTFTTPHGRRVLKYLMEAHGVLTTSFVEKDPQATAFNEGGRNAILQIINKLKIDVHKAESMMTEKFKYEQEDTDYVD